MATKKDFEALCDIWDQCFCDGWLAYDHGKKKIIACHNPTYPKDRRKTQAMRALRWVYAEWSPASIARLVSKIILRDAALESVRAVQAYFAEESKGMTDRKWSDILIDNPDASPEELTFNQLLQAISVFDPHRFSYYGEKNKLASSYLNDKYEEDYKSEVIFARFKELDKYTFWIDDLYNSVVTYCDACSAISNLIEEYLWTDD